MEFFRARMRANPRDAEAAARLAQILLERDAEEAARLARRAARVGAGPDAAETLARALLGRGAPETAIAVLEAVLERHPARAGTRYRLGLARVAAGDRKGAAAELRRALEGESFPEADDARRQLAKLERASAER